MTLKHSPTLFLDDCGNGLHLVIKSDLEKAGVKELIKHGGGLICNESTEYSITFASPDCEVMEDEELYSYEYIKDCCGQNKLLDLKPYRLNKHSKYPASFNPNDVFLKYTTWTDALQGKSFERFVLPFDPDLSTDSSSSSDETSLPQVPTSSGMKRREYTESERKKIIKYIIENKGYSSVKGRELWQKMEEKKICPGRTWQSLKEHFTKKILPRIDKFDLTEKELRKFKTQGKSSSSSDTEFSESLLTSQPKEENSSSSDTESSESTPTSESQPKKKRTTELETIDLVESSGIEFCAEENYLEIKDKSTNEEKESSCAEDKEDRAPLTRFRVAKAFTKSTQEIKKTRERSSSENEDSDWSLKESSLSSPSEKKVQRREYTEVERKKIIKYIKENKAYASVKGREFWQKMEGEEICPGRTWQSLKEHFTKKILPSIDKFDLPEKEVRKFKAQEEKSSDTGASEPVPTAQSKSKKRRKIEFKKIYVVESSESEFCDEENDLEIEDKSTNKEKEISFPQDDLEIEDKSTNKEKEILYSQDVECSVPLTRTKVAAAFAKDVHESKKPDVGSSSESVNSSCNSRETPLTGVSGKKYQRREYTESERKKIIKYIIENKAYISVKGREFWQKMEEKEICPGRTWQSLKEHFNKKILPRIDRFGLREKEVRGFKGQEENSRSSDTDSPEPSFKRRDYSKAEKMEIINYIIRCKAYKYVKGREFWQRMEMKQICPGRTWQSMKEHYTKQMIPRIHSFGLPVEEAERLKMMYK